MAPLKGLTGMYPDPQDTADVMDEGVLEAKANTLDAEHSQYGTQEIGYSGVVPLAVPYAGQQVYDGYDPGFANAFGGMTYPVGGVEQDKTPLTHSSPYPRGIIQSSWDEPDALARVGGQVAELHSQELGGSAFYNGNSPTGHMEETNYTTDDYVAPNENYLDSAVPDQIRGNGKGLDTTQGYGVLNTLPEFNSGHSIRRVQHDSMHFDYTNTHGEQAVPFYGRHPVQQNELDGPDSPYFDQGSIDGAMVVWEGRIGDPSPYVQPSEPTIAASGPQAADVWAWA